MEFYELFDLLQDLYEYSRIYGSRKIDYDRLVLWIYRKHKGTIALNTIIRALTRAHKNNFIEIITPYRTYKGYRYRQKAIVFIYESEIRRVILTRKTITLPKTMKKTIFEYLVRR